MWISAPLHQLAFTVDRKVQGNFTITPQPVHDSQHAIYIEQTYPSKLDGTDFSPAELAGIFSQQCFVNHHETIKGGESSNGNSGCLKKICTYSESDLSGKQEFRIQEVPIGMSIMWEAVLLHLLLIYSQDHWNECRILSFTFAKQCLRRINSLFANNPNYNGPNSSTQQRFSHGYFAGELDIRSRQLYIDGPSKAGNSTY